MIPKLKNLSIFTLKLFFGSLIAFGQVPENWDLYSSYSNGSLVIHEGVAYLAQQELPAGSPAPGTDAMSWMSLDDLAPTSAPTSSPPTTTPDIGSAPSDSPPESTDDVVEDNVTEEDELIEEDLTEDTDIGEENLLPDEWDLLLSYSMGSLVLFDGTSYLALREVPTGVSIDSKEYWISLDDSIPSDIPGDAPIEEIDLSTIPGEIPLEEENLSYVLQVFAGSNGLADGNGTYEYGTNAELYASADPGYVFTGWSGDASGESSSLSLVMDMDKVVYASFSPDLDDFDQDGLSNYDEFVLYNTDPYDSDADLDGLTDGEEIEFGLDPRISNHSLIEFIAQRSSDGTPYNSSDAYEEGKMEVMNNPANYSLISIHNHASMLTDAFTIQNQSATLYTAGWFFIEDRGWLYSDPSFFPYFFDITSEGWLYFESGREKPTFYDYSTGLWMQFEY